MICDNLMRHRKSDSTLGPSLSPLYTISKSFYATWEIILCNKVNHFMIRHRKRKRRDTDSVTCMAQSPEEELEEVIYFMNTNLMLV